MGVLESFEPQSMKICSLALYGGVAERAMVKRWRRKERRGKKGMIFSGD